MPETDFPEGVLVSETRNGPFQTEVLAAGRRLVIDQPVSAGGMGMGPDPFDLLAAALGACTAMTVRLHALQRQWSLESIRVAVTVGLAAETRQVQFERLVELEGNLTDDHRADLLAAAERSPVGQALQVRSTVSTRLGPIGSPELAARRVSTAHMIAMEQALRAS
jgi:putative redox protein